MHQNAELTCHTYRIAKQNELCLNDFVTYKRCRRTRQKNINKTVVNDEIMIVRIEEIENKI